MRKIAKSDVTKKEEWHTELPMNSSMNSHIIDGIALLRVWYQRSLNLDFICI